MAEPGRRTGAQDALVRRVDSDRWLASRFAPTQTRAHLVALYALNHEIAKTAETVRERDVGVIRLAWWRDALAEIARGEPPRAHPVLREFAAAHAACKLPLAVFEPMIAARARDLDAQPFAAWADQTDYIDATAGALLHLALALCGGGAPDQFTRDAGRAWGLAGLLRARDFWQARGRTPFPAGARDTEAAARLMANTARAAHAEAKRHAPHSALFPAFGYLALVPRFLKKPGEPTLIERQARILAASLAGAI